VDDLTVRPIGFLRTPFTRVDDMPIQPSGARGVAGSIEILPQYLDGLADLDGYSHIIVLYHFHRAPGARLKVKPFLDDVERGVFSTRAPCRPNPIGLSLVRLIRVDGPTVHIADIDALDGTPVLDIKPYVPDFDAALEVRLGWLERLIAEAGVCRSDARFSGGEPGVHPPECGEPG
jgi:tRNA (adenine37-N6)-methyltransferase